MYEYRHVVLPQDIAKRLPKDKLLSEAEWRALGVQQSRGWGEWRGLRVGSRCGRSAVSRRAGCCGRAVAIALCCRQLPSQSAREHRGWSHPLLFLLHPPNLFSVHYARHRPVSEYRGVGVGEQVVKASSRAAPFQSCPSHSRHPLPSFLGPGGVLDGDVG